MKVPCLLPCCARICGTSSGRPFAPRLDDKHNGAIVLVMQRLHEDDLAGILLRGSDEWTVLSLPAIAEQDEQIPIGNGRIHFRQAGDVLHPERESRDVLESLRAQLGAETFAAQYQQQPMTPGGAMIKRAWVRRYCSYNPESSRAVRCSSRRRPHGLQISKRSFSRFQAAGTTIRWTA